MYNVIFFTCVNMDLESIHKPVPDTANELSKSITELHCPSIQASLFKSYINYYKVKSLK